MTVNKAILLGNLGRDPETRYTASGDPVTNFSIATTERYKKDGQQQEKTEWHNCVAFKKAAEIIGEHAKKGSMVYVEGKIQTQSYEKDGVTKYSTQIIVDKFSFVGPKPDQSNQENSTRHSYEDGKAMDDDFDDSIPF